MKHPIKPFDLLAVVTMVGFVVYLLAASALVNS